jgi:hypothetical protein
MHRSVTRRAPSRRDDQGGAAMLVTLLVLTSATALGIFAAYATSSEVQTAGTVRATAQSEYVSDYAARLGRDLSALYVPNMVGGSSCPEMTCDPNLGTCVAVSKRLFLTDFVNIETMATGQASDVVSPNVGTFGHTPVWPYASITFDDLLARPVHVAGEQMNDPQSRPIECHFRMSVDGSTVGVTTTAAGLDDPHVNTQRVRAFGRVGASP